MGFQLCLDQRLPQIKIWCKSVKGFKNCDRTYRQTYILEQFLKYFHIPWRNVDPSPRVWLLVRTAAAHGHTCRSHHQLIPSINQYIFVINNSLYQSINRLFRKSTNLQIKSNILNQSNTTFYQSIKYWIINRFISKSTNQCFFYIYMFFTFR